MKKTISIYDNNYNWHKFDFEKAEDLIEVLKPFSIKLSPTAKLGHA